MDYFKMKNQKNYLNVPYAEFFIPAEYFTDNHAEDYRDSLSTLGIFQFIVYPNGKPKSNSGSVRNESKNPNLHTMLIPTTIELTIHNSREESVILSDGIVKKYKVLEYLNGEEICNNYMVENSDNTIEYLNMVLDGKLPDTIPYSNSLTLFMNNMELNNVRFPVSSVDLEIMLMMVYRNRDDMEETFSKVIGKNPNVSQYAYEVASTRQVCQYTSTLTALTFEDIDTMITSSINRTRSGKKEPYSPSEKIIKM